MALVFLINFTLLQSVIGQIKEESGVWVLTESNMDQAFSLQKRLLVEIYAPRCEHCEKFAPVYEKAALRLLSLTPPIRIAKINGIENESLLTKYEIKGFPTLLYFINGEPSPYTGDRTEDSIFSFAYSNSRPKIEEVNTNKDLDDILQYNKCNVILFASSSSNEYKDFDTVSKDFSEIGFIFTDSEQLAEEFRVKQPGLVLLKNLRNERVYFDKEFSVVNLSEFIKKNRVSIVIEFDSEAVKSIFGDNKNAIFLLTVDYDKYKVEFETLAMVYRQTLLFVQADLNTAAEGKLASFLNLSPDQQPTAMILQPSKNIAKYRNKGEFSIESLKDLIDDWVNDKAQRYFKSDPLPVEPYEDGIRILVGQNFEEVVSDKNFDILVYFYSNSCSVCEQYNVLYPEVAKEFKAIREELVFAKICTDSNDVDFHLEGIPMIVAFTKKNKQGIVYGDNLDMDFFKAYLTEVFTREDQAEDEDEAEFEEIQEQYKRDSDEIQHTDL